MVKERKMLRERERERERERDWFVEHSHTLVYGASKSHRVPP